MIFIPPKDTEHCVMNFFDTETGENLGQVENIKEISMSHFSETEEEHNKHGDINWFNYKNEEYTMSVDFDKEIDTNELHKILGIDISNMPDVSIAVGISRFFNSLNKFIKNFTCRRGSPPVTVTPPPEGRI